MPLVDIKTDSAGVATLWLNDPDRRNAMSEAMADQFAAAINQLQRDQNLRAVVVTGAGLAFSAGGDLNMLLGKPERDPETNRRDMLRFYDSFLGILRLHVPLIAAINGHAMGAGLCLALACDFRVISSDARIGLNFVRLGLHPGMGATYLLPRIAGYNVAMDLLLTGRTLSAATSAGMRLFHEIVPAPEVLPTAYRLSSSMHDCGPVAVQQTLATLRPAPTELARALEREAEMQSLNYAGDEFRRCLEAALARTTREPDSQNWRAQI